VVKLDLKDKKILNELFIDSRQSFRSIGRNVGLSKDIVANRVNKLKELGIIERFYTEINLFKLGYLCFRFYLSFQNTTPEIKREIIGYFKDCKYSTLVVSIKGEYDLVLFVFFKRMDDFFSFWRKTLIKYRNYFHKQAISAYNQYRIYKYQFLIDDESDVFNKYNKEKDVTISGGEKAKSDDLDFQILKLLSVNSRISTIEIAEKLNSNTNTVTARIRRLKDFDVIQGYTINIDHLALDYYVYKANIQLKDYTKRAAMIDYIEKNTALRMIDESAGFVDLELNFVVKDPKHFHQIMEDLESRFPNNIKDYNYFYIEKFHKFQFIPDE